MLRQSCLRLLGLAQSSQPQLRGGAVGAVRGYHERVVDHNNPRNVGSFDKDDPDVGTGLVGAPACGDVMKLQINVDDKTGKIVDARFKTFGCGSAIASSSVATKWVKGKQMEGILSYMGALDSEQNQLIEKLANFHMKEGKRTKVHAIICKTFHRLSRTEGDVIKLMVDAVENIKPICKVEKVRVAGTLYDVPGIVAKDRQQTLAIRWILEAAFKRRINNRISLDKCLFDEILDAYRKKGIARKKRENLHGLASANRSFAHFRWW